MPYRGLLGVPTPPGAGRRRFDTNHWLVHHVIWWWKNGNFQHLPTAVKRQRRPGDDKNPSQTALNIPRSMPRNPWRREGSDVRPKYEAVDRSYPFDLVNYTIFGAPDEHLIYVSWSLAMCRRNLLFVLDTLVFTDWRKTNSTFREEPPKMVTFHENWDSPCNIDDPGWNLAASREAADSTVTTCPGYPGVLRIKEEAQEETIFGDRPSCDDRCRRPASPRDN